MTRSPAKRMPIFLLGVFTLILFLLALRDFFSVGMLAYGDTPPVINAEQAFQAFFSSWQPMSRGINIPYNQVLFIVGIMDLLVGGNTVLVQKVFFILPMPLSFLTMYLFLGRFTRSVFGRWFASFAYAVNPVTIGTGYIGGTGGWIYVNAFAPLVVGSFIDVFKPKHEVRNILIFTVFTTLGATFGGLHIVLYLIPFLLYLFLRHILRREIKFLFKRSILFIASFVLFIGLTFTYIYYGSPILSFLPSISSHPSLPGAGVSGLVGLIRMTYSYESMFNILSFQRTALGFFGYTSDAWWTLCGFIYVILAFSSLLFVRKERGDRYVLYFTIFALSIISFLWLTMLGPGLKVFIHFPFLFFATNPSPFCLMLMFGFAPLIAKTLERVLELCSKKRITLPVISINKIPLTKILVVVIVIFIGSAYVWPFFTGNMGIASTGHSIERELTIPAVYYRAAEWLDAHNTDGVPFRTLWVPMDYQTQLYLKDLDPEALTIPMGIEQYITLSMITPLENVYTSFVENKIDNIGSLLAPLNVKYIIVNMESTSTGVPSTGGLFLSGSPSAYAEILNRQTDLRLVENQPDFSVYENQAFQPRVNIFNSAYFIAASNDEAQDPLFIQALSNLLLRLPNYDPSNSLMFYGGSLNQTQQLSLMEECDATILYLSNINQIGVNISDLEESKSIYEIVPIPISWIPESGQWSVPTKDELVGIAPYMAGTWSQGILYYNDLNLSDFTVEAKLCINSVEGGGYQTPGFFIRYSSSGTYLVRIESGYNRIAIYSSTGWTESVSVPIGENTWYDLKVITFGPSGNVHFSVYLNGTKYIDTVDTSPDEPASGYIGLSCQGYSAGNQSFKDVTITDPDGNVLSSFAMPNPVTTGEVNTPIFKAGNYSVLIESPAGEPTNLYIGDNAVGIAKMLADGWYESQLIYLDNGSYSVKVDYPLSYIVTEGINIYVLPQPSPENEWLSPTILNLQRISATEYQATVKHNSSVFIQLSEAYSPEWKAYANGVELTHLTLGPFYLNGYYLEGSGVDKITIRYEGQNIKNMTIIVWIASWIFVLGSLLYLSRSRISSIIQKRHRYTNFSTLYKTVR